MAIFSLHHTAIGRSTQARPHTAAAHVEYIARPQAMSRFETARFPIRPAEAARKLRTLEDGDRANARIADKVMLALPRELDAAQRISLVRGFAEEVTKGRAPWLAAFHDKGKDEANPHCHLLIRDRDPDTGRRVIGMSEAGSTERLRTLWEAHTNQALAAAGVDARVDRRSLAAQGIDRTATIHEGPKSRAMDRRGAAPRSKPVNARNGRGARSRMRRVDYPAIDNGRSRVAYNREARAGETASDYWAAIDADRQRREFAAMGYGADWRRHERLVGTAVPLAGGGRNVEQEPVALSATGGVPGSVLSPPFLTPGLVLGPGTFEPPPEGIGERGDERTKALEQRGNNRLVNAVVEPLVIKTHTNIVGRTRNDEKGITMDFDEQRRRAAEYAHQEAQRRADQTKALYDNAMDKSYLDPKKAEERMNRYRAKHGNDALYEKLNGNARKIAFGRRPGSILSANFFTYGAGQRRQDSQIARQNLGDLTRMYHQDQERLAGAKRALADLDQARQARPPGQGAAPDQQGDHSRSPQPTQEPAPQPGAPERSPSFSERLAQPRSAEPPASPAQRSPEPEKAAVPTRGGSFSERLAQRQADPQTRERDAEQARERMRRERGKGIEIGD